MFVKTLQDAFCNPAYRYSISIKKEENPYGCPSLKCKPYFLYFTRLHAFYLSLQFYNSLPKENALYSLDRRFAARYSTGDMPVYFLKTCEKYEKFEYPTFVAMRLTGMFVSLSKDCAARIFSVTI